MAEADVGHHTDVGPGDPAEPVHLAKIADAHFQHRHLIVLPDAEHGQRHAQLVVKVALGLAYPELLFQHRGDHFFRTGLSHASHDTHHRDRQRFPVKFRDILQRLIAGSHLDVRAFCLRRSVLHQHRCRAFFKHLRHERVTVHPLAF